MPEEKLLELKGKRVKESAEYFGVPEEMVRLRLTFFGANIKRDSQHL
jgi:Zn-dependent peptidase ImmA (M78 family)